jgi:hypothetical protein
MRIGRYGNLSCSWGTPESGKEHAPRLPVATHPYKGFGGIHYAAFSVSPFLHLLVLGDGFDDFVALSNGFGLVIEFIPATSSNKQFTYRTGMGFSLVLLAEIRLRGEHYPTQLLMDLEVMVFSPL